MDEDEFRRALGGELRRYRLACGWTQAQLVEQMSQPVSTGALESYESGSREISVFRLVQLCTVLVVRPPTTAPGGRTCAAGGGAPEVCVALAPVAPPVAAPVCDTPPSGQVGAW